MLRVAHQKLTAINDAYQVLSALLPQEETPPIAEPAARPTPQTRRDPAASEPFTPRRERWSEPEPESAFFAGEAATAAPQNRQSKYRPEEIWRYHQAAEQGFESAQYELGMLYYHGDGVPKDLVESYKWLSLAAAAKGRAHLKADHYLERVRACLDRVQVEEAQARMAPFTRRSSIRV